MLFLSAIFLGLLTHVLAQAITDPAILTAATTPAGSAASGICSDESYASLSPYSHLVPIPKQYADDAFMKTEVSSPATLPSRSAPTTHPSHIVLTPSSISLKVRISNFPEHVP